jgi:DNA polymerase elongation subunit (family B)/rRNA maturation protein Nop10
MKILLLDIETAPHVGYVWGLWQQNIGLNQLLESGYVLCWSAKWFGSEELFFDSVHRSKPKAMLKRIHALLDEADAVIHYNGTKFDIPTLNKEFLLNRMTPPASYRQIDLYQTAKTRFRFASNKLDYIAAQLGVGKKHKHEGFELWVKCMNGDEKAWETMEAYNKQDVGLLEGVYEIFKPWIRNHPNVALYNAFDEPSCPVCGGDNVVKRGYSYTAVGKYQRYRCSDCGHWSRDRVNVGETPKLVSDKV